MHHEQYPKFQVDYQFDDIALEDAFEQLGKSFWEDSRELLDNAICMPPDELDNENQIGFQLYTAVLKAAYSVTMNLFKKFFIFFLNHL